MIAKALLTSISLAISITGATAGLKSSGGNSSSIVTWDKYSLKIDGAREFIFSGEFHYYRLPSPDLWSDVFQKFKALGYNTASLYFFWGYHSARQGVYDFEGVRDVQKVLDDAKSAGIHVIARPGPYINAEVNAGGFPGWLETINSTSRQPTSAYTKAYEEWLSAMDKYLIPAEIGNGGPIILTQIENEYTDTSSDGQAYMQAIQDFYRSEGMTVPFSFNDVSPDDAFASGKGAVDVYGFDSYPVGFDCSHPDVWPKADSNNWRAYHESVNPTEPLAIYEFQGGSFDPWGGPGYDKCLQLVNEQFAKVFYKNNYAQGTTIQSLYMSYGGTTWGESPEPGVYTSYDYAAPISEARMMTPKGYEIKLQATFLRTVKDFVATTNVTGATDNSNIRIDGLQSVSSDALFYVVQQTVTSSTTAQKFHIDAKTKNGTITIPQKAGTNLLLNGRDAKIITTSYDFESQHLMYSTSEIFTHFSQDTHDVILVYAYEGEDGEIAITSSSNKVTVNGSNASVTSALNGTTLQINYHHPNGTTYINAIGQKGTDVLLVVAGYDAATKWWAPVTSSGKTLMIQGPYLVRSAEIQGSRLAFTGDTDSITSIEIVAPKEIRSVTWNGMNVSVKRTSYGTLTGKISGPAKISLPDLTKSIWKYSPASPETNATYDDSKWVAADHTTTNNPKLTPNTLPVLYADDYGYHYGSLWFRGSFNATSEITGLAVNATMGSGSAWVAWLNGQYLGGVTQDSNTFKLNSSVLQTGKENVLSLLMWTTGHEEDSSSGDEYKTPRGFSGVALEGAENTTITWKVQGNLGGEHIVDTTRGPYNEGGLYGERNGWHLPGYPDNGWKSVSLPESTPRSGVSWYRTTFDLNIPKEHDVPLGIQFHNSTSERYRSLLFINGWQFGKYANDLGPQSLFYVPEGILNHNGQNTIAIGVIAIDESVSLAGITIEPYGALRSSKPTVSLVKSPNYSQLKSHYH